MARKLQATAEEVQATAEEVQATTEELQATTGKLQATAEEVQATAEEVQATAEEVQATTEEVQATTEEVQATTEEVQAMAEELQAMARKVLATAEKVLAMAEEVFGSKRGNSDMLFTKRHWLLVSSILGLLGCSLLNNPNPLRQLSGIEVFETFLNLDVGVYTADEIDSIEVKKQTSATILTTTVYMTYTASESFLNSLQAHKSFVEVTPLNQPIKSVRCNSSDIPSDFTYWTDDTIPLNGMNCYMGVFFPYMHIIVYNPTNNQTHHFIAGMRD